MIEGAVGLQKMGEVMLDSNMLMGGREAGDM